MTTPVLEIIDLTKRFGDLTAVAELSVAVPPGVVFGLLGPNGAGKTTTIRAICGETAPDAGRILLHGRPLGRSAADRARVGLCPQELVVWDRLTCREQLESLGGLYGMPAAAGRRRAGELLEALDLAAKAGVLGSDLSGGMRRRLNIALALVHEPELVILDEPGAGLDPQSRVMVRDFVRSLARSSTVLLTTHDMDEAERICDRVAVVDRGRVLVDGTPTGLLGCGDGLRPAELIEFRFGLPVEERAAALFRERDTALDVRAHPGMLTVASAEPGRLLPELTGLLRSAGIPADEARLRRRSLEDLFLELTGRTVR